MFWAENCAHCLDLLEDWEAMATYYKPLTSLTIAKIDGAKNQVKDIEILSYPTIMLYINDMKDKPFLYGGS